MQAMRSWWCWLRATTGTPVCLSSDRNWRENFSRNHSLSFYSASLRPPTNRSTRGQRSVDQGHGVPRCYQSMCYRGCRDVVSRSCCLCADGDQWCGRKILRYFEFNMYVCMIIQMSAHGHTCTHAPHACTHTHARTRARTRANQTRQDHVVKIWLSTCVSLVVHMIKLMVVPSR